MAKRRTISYRTTALIALVGGGVSLAAAIVQTYTDIAGVDLGSVWSVVGGVAILVWFLAAASGVLAISTQYKRWAIAGLVMCGLAIVVFLVTPAFTS